MPSDSAAAIALKHVSKRYFLNRNEPFLLGSFARHPLRSLRALRGEPFWAVRDVSMDIVPGEVVGIIGPNGSGKSTLLRMILGISQPSEGQLVLNGRVSGLLELGAGFHPNATGRENVYLNGLLMGLRKEQMRRLLPEIIEFAGLQAFADQPTRTYSTGMHVRLGFSVAVHLRPDILLVDEVLAVGDAEFQEKCFQHFRELRQEGKTIVLVSHDLVSIRNLADRVALMDQGRLVTCGEPAPVIAKYLIEHQHRSAASDQFFQRAMDFTAEMQEHLTTGASSGGKPG